MNAIARTAQLGAGCQLGHYVVVEEGAVIGEGCQIGHHVVIHPGARIGRGVRIDDHAVVGKQPMRAANSAVTTGQQAPPPVVGDGCILGTGVVVYAGATLGQGVLVADLATIREEVTVGDFTIVGRGACIENRCRVGRYCKLETNAYITAYSELEDHVFVAPGVVTSNDNYVGRSEERFKHFKGVQVRRGGRLGANSTILPGKVIGEDSLVAAGSVVTRDTPPGKVVLGSPARELRSVPQDQLLQHQKRR